VLVERVRHDAAHEHLHARDRQPIVDRQVGARPVRKTVAVAAEVVGGRTDRGLRRISADARRVRIPKQIGRENGGIRTARVVVLQRGNVQGSNRAEADVVAGPRAQAMPLI
jgi:hypothetical protein